MIQFAYIVPDTHVYFSKHAILLINPGGLSDRKSAN